MTKIPTFFQTPRNQTTIGVAVLVSCLVRTLNESDPTFRRKFLDKLSTDYDELRGMLGDDCLDMLTWTNQVVDEGNFNPPPDIPTLKD